MNVDSGVLTIEGRHKEDRREEDANHRYLRVERSLGTVRRSLRLPEDVEESKVTAKYDHGVLKVSLPKQHESQRARGNVDIIAAESSAEGQQASGAVQTSPKAEEATRGGAHAESTTSM